MKTIAALILTLSVSACAAKPSARLHVPPFFTPDGNVHPKWRDLNRLIGVVDRWLTNHKPSA